MLDAVREELAAADGPGGTPTVPGDAAAASRSAVAIAAGGVAAGALHVQPYSLLRTLTTRAMPVVHVAFTPRNLLLAAGPAVPPPLPRTG